MTSLFNTILKVFFPVTASHQSYIVSNVSLKNKTEKFSQTHPPSLPTTSVLYTQIPWFHAGLTRPRSPIHMVRNKKKQKQIHRHTHRKPTLTLSILPTPALIHIPRWSHRRLPVLHFVILDPSLSMSLSRSRPLFSHTHRHTHTPTPALTYTHQDICLHICLPRWNWKHDVLFIFWRKNVVLTLWTRASWFWVSIW